MFNLLNIETGHIEKLTVQEVFSVLNTDRNPDWSEYTLNSTLEEIIEGIDNFTHYECMK